VLSSNCRLSMSGDLYRFAQAIELGIETNYCLEWWTEIEILRLASGIIREDVGDVSFKVRF